MERRIRLELNEFWEGIAKFLAVERGSVQGKMREIYIKKKTRRKWAKVGD